MINVIKKKGANPITKQVLHFIQWTRVSTVLETALAKKMARGGTYSVGEASGVMLDFEIKNYETHTLTTRGEHANCHPAVSLRYSLSPKYFRRIFSAPF